MMQGAHKSHRATKSPLRMRRFHPGATGTQAKAGKRTQGAFPTRRRGPILRRVSRSDVFVVLSILVALAFQVWVTIKVRRSSEYDAGQKNAQTKLIWLLPILGAAVAFAVLEDDPKRPPQDKQQS